MNKNIGIAHSIFVPYLALYQLFHVFLVKTLISLIIQAHDVLDDEV